MAGPTPTNQFSFSRVKSFQQCPAAYRYRYLKRIKEAFRSVESFLGSTVHDVLEWLYERRDQGSSPTAEQACGELRDRFEAGWSEDIAIVKVATRREDYLADGLSMVDRFHRTTFVRDRSETIALERRLSLRLSDDLHFTGFADRIGRTGGGTLFVVDYKTSRSVGDPSDPFSEGLQAPLYAACALHDREDEHANAGYHYLRHGSTSWHRVDRERGGELIERFRAHAEEAMAAREFPARPGVLCAWCGFNALCPDAQVGDQLRGGVDMARTIGGDLLP